MTVLVTKNPNLFVDISYTPRFDEAEPIAIGIPLVEAGENPRYAVIHDIPKITQEWIELYCQGENPVMEIRDSMPEDWKYQGST
jgi:hypothetical protein